MTATRHVLVLVGPTASGKTEIALHLARLLHGEILSADSRQIYKYLDIGTAKPSLALRREVRHYFVDELTPDQEFNAGEFGAQGRRIIDDVLGRGKVPLVVGGSGLYVQSLIDGFFEGPGADWEFREWLERRVAKGELEELVEQLRNVDPAAAAHADPTKPRRIIRALEVYHLTGKPLSEQQTGARVTINFAPALFGLEWNRAILYDRINKRSEQMIATGLLDEVEQLEKRGYTGLLNSLNTVGYAEAFAYRRGELSRDEMLRLFKQNSRRYAKRQITWFRRDKRIHWVSMKEGFEAAAVAREIAREFKSAKR